MTTTLAAAVATYPPDMPEWAVADDLNTPKAIYGVKRIDVPVWAGRGLLMRHGVWGSLVIAAESAVTPPDLRVAAITARDSLLYLDSINTADPAVYDAVNAMLTVLEAGGIIDNPIKIAMLNLSEMMQSWSDVNFNSVPVTARDVGIARGGIA